MADDKPPLRRFLQQAIPAPAQTEHHSLFVYARFRWLWIALLLCGASIIAYALHDPWHGPAGNTWLGYTLGTVGAGLILWLAWLGVRKRQFRTGTGRVQGWVSAHVYLGLSLLIIVTLHSGFQLDFNVHGLAYGLMVLVIASGIYGVIAYTSAPARITRARGSREFRDMLHDVEQLGEQALQLADDIDAETRTVVERSIAGSQPGGNLREQLGGRYRKPDSAALERFLEAKGSTLSAPPSQQGGRQATIAFFADQLFDAGRNPKGEKLRKLLKITAERKALVECINRDITLRARMNIWLYLHVPATVALLTALLVHIVAVFLYW